eukprot:SAG11_NODE_254_length_11587_cov_4.312913_3_plen_118_part_00
MRIKSCALWDLLLQRIGAQSLQGHIVQISGSTRAVDGSGDWYLILADGTGFLPMTRPGKDPFFENVEVAPKKKKATGGGGGGLVAWDPKYQVAREGGVFKNDGKSKSVCASRRRRTS